MSTPTTPITWADIVRLKKAAKAAKATHPELSSMQRLDAMTQQEFGLRHFHELRRRYDAHVASFVELNGMHHCRFCHLNFSDYDAGDRQWHRERHERFDDAQLALGFLPLPFKVREDLKRYFGYEQLYYGDAAAKRMGALAIMLSHYDRSLERAIENGRWQKHPCFLEYLPCAIASANFPASHELLQQFADEFGVRPGVIAVGDPDWPAAVKCEAGNGSTAAAESRQLRESILAAFHAAQAVETA